jgi:hypothetical protein
MRVLLPLVTSAADPPHALIQGCGMENMGNPENPLQRNIWTVVSDLGHPRGLRRGDLLKFGRVELKVKESRIESPAATESVLSLRQSLGRFASRTRPARGERL